MAGGRDSLLKNKKRFPRTLRGALREANSVFWVSVSHAPGDGIAAVFEGLVRKAHEVQAALAFTQAGLLGAFDELVGGCFVLAFPVQVGDQHLAIEVQDCAVAGADELGKVFDRGGLCEVDAMLFHGVFLRGMCFPFR